MKYYISDLLFFHKEVKRAGKDFGDRTFDSLEERHSIIKERWNTKVMDVDTVYILGDMAMRGTQKEIIEFVSTLKGHKILIRGNHDKVKDVRYKQLYDEICDYKEVRDTLYGENVKLILCHYPILMWKDQHYGSILLYGHVHNSIEERYFKECLREMNNNKFFERRGRKNFLQAYNVGCMMPYMNYEPQTLTQIIEKGSQYEEKLLYRVRKIADEAKIIVDCIAFTKKDDYIYAVNLENIHERTQFSCIELQVISTNMSEKAIRYVKKLLKRNIDFLI